MPQLFVNLAVNDLDVAKKFYTAIGFTLNPAFSDHNVACFVIDANHNYVMVHTREFYQTFTELPLGDPAVNPTSSSRAPATHRRSRPSPPRRCCASTCPS